MRAVSIQVDAVSSVSGFVSPGDHVDILLTRNVDGQIVSSIPLQDIEILAVDQDQGSEGRSARVGRTVTVKVTPRQAQELAVARQLGKLSLTLRGKGATSAAKSNPPVTQDELDDLEKPETKKKKQIKVNRPDGAARRKTTILRWKFDAANLPRAPRHLHDHAFRGIISGRGEQPRNPSYGSENRLVNDLWRQVHVCTQP
jgi:Flp pilus assembly protein CpaB